MRRFAALIMAITASASPAQVVPFDPAAEYITIGQDEPGYRAWVLADLSRPPAIAAYYAFLVRQGVAGIVPTWQLLRTATGWQRCAAQPFEVPPSDQWPHIVETLRYINGHLIPAIGPVEPVSVYRNPTLNACAGGAPGSAHQELYAIDLVPLRPIDRDGLIRAICAVHLSGGSAFDIGIGFYKGLRFHVDSKKFREWGGGGENSPCAAVNPVPQSTAPTDPLAPLMTSPPPVPITTPPPVAAPRP